MRKHLINLFGGKVTPSQSLDTNFGKKMLDIDKENPGSLGIAISEALEVVFSKNKAAFMFLHFEIITILCHHCHNNIIPHLLEEILKSYLLLPPCLIR